MSATPPRTGRHEAAPGRDGDLIDTPAPTERPRAGVWLIGVLAGLFALVVAGFGVMHNHSYWGLPHSTVVVTSATPDGTMDEGRTTCDASRFAVRATADGRTGSFRDCQAAYQVGQQIRVVWSPTDPTVVDPHVQQPLDIALTAGVVALVPVCLAGLGSLVRRRKALSG